MALTAVGIAVGVASAAEAGYSAKRGHDQQVQAKHQASDSLARQSALDQQLAASQKANQDRAAQDLQFQRQRALALSTGSNTRSGTIRTTPGGVPGGGSSPRVGGNSYLGAA